MYIRTDAQNNCRARRRPAKGIYTFDQPDISPKNIEVLESYIRSKDWYIEYTYASDHIKGYFIAQKHNNTIQSHNIYVGESTTLLASKSAMLLQATRENIFGKEYATLVACDYEDSPASKIKNDTKIYKDQASLDAYFKKK